MKTKTSKLGVTGSRKNRRRLSIDVIDELDDRLRTIELLADLMGVCRAEFLPPRAVENAGLAIAGEVRGIKAVLRKAGDLCHE
jgi:hypothetical protein